MLTGRCEMLCKICILEVHIQHTKRVLDHADRMASTAQRELDHTSTDQ